jgi:hypothetical protein
MTEDLIKYFDLIPKSLTDTSKLEQKTEFEIGKIYKTNIFSVDPNKPSSSLPSSFDKEYEEEDDSSKLTKITVCFEVDYYKKFMTLNYENFFYNYILNTPIQNKNMNEVINKNQLQKIYFDIDIKISDEKMNLINIKNLIDNLFSSIIIASNNIIKKEDIMLFSSHSPLNNFQKISFHIVIANYFVLSSTHNKSFYYLVLKNIDQKYHEYIDCLYKSSQQLRIYGSSKSNENRFKKLDNNSGWKCIFNHESGESDHDNENLKKLMILKNSLIGFTTECVLLNIEIDNNFKSKKNYDDIDFNIEEAVKLFYKNNPKNIDIFPTYEVNNNFITMFRKKSGYCDVCHRVHDNSDCFLRISKNLEVFHMCFRKNKYNNAKLLGKINNEIFDKYLYDELILKYPKISLNIYNKKYCDDLIYDYKFKIQMVKSYCGSGKTTILKNFVKKCFLDNLSICVFVTRQSSSYAISSEFNNILSELKFENYLERSNDSFIKSKYTIVSAESCFKLENVYDVIIFDESTSFLKQMNSPFMKNLEFCRKILDLNIINSKFLLFLDADLDERTYKFCSDKLPNELIHLNINIYNNTSKLIYTEKKIREIYELIELRLNNDKNIQINVGTVNDGLRICYHLLSKRIIKKDDILFHYSEGDDFSDILKNVNKNWCKRILIYTNCIGPLIDFNILHFHTRFEIGHFGCSNIREFFQSSYRVRNLIDNEIFFCHKSQNRNKLYNKDDIIEQLNHSILKNNKINNFISNNVTHDVNQETRKILKRLDISNIYVDLEIDYLVETNMSYNNFYEEYIERVLEQKSSLFLLSKAIKNKLNEEDIKFSIYYGELKKEIENEKLFLISNFSKYEFKNLYETIYYNSLNKQLTKEDKINFKLLNFRKKVIDYNDLMEEVVSFNLDDKNYKKILLYRIFTGMNEIDWLNIDISNFNENKAKNKLITYKLYFLKYIIKKLGLSFEESIDGSELFKIMALFQSEFKNLVYVFGLQTKKIPENYRNTINFLESLLMCIGLEINSKKYKLNKKICYKLKLEYMSDLFEDSVKIYNPFKYIDNSNIDLLYDENIL